MRPARWILAAIVLFAPVWAGAAETTYLLNDTLSDSTAFRSLADPIDPPEPQLFAPIRLAQPQETWAPVSWTVGDAAVESGGSLAPSSAGEEESATYSPGCCPKCQRYVCVCRCAPHICRFDHPADCTGCVTHQYCGHPCMGNTGQCHQTGNGGCWLCEGCGCDVQGRPSYGPDTAVRFGWWGVHTEGDPLKVGEFQDLDASPFWDVDSILTDGSRTLDFALSGLDNEASFARAYYYGGPGLATKFRYNRFLRRWDHDPLSVFDLGSGVPAESDNEVGEDLNVGEDYAIRVQQLDARFQGRLSENLKWRLNLWGLRKFGERQANATAHCFNIGPANDPNNTCHVLSQRQSIDWLTMEIEPAVEARWGDVVVEYSRTMRGFQQDDQLVERTYSRFDFSPASGTEGPPFIYAFVPDNFTQIDRVKINVPLNPYNQFYGHVYIGDTENKLRDTHRDFNGYDLRWINRGIDDVTLTGYVKVDTQDNEVSSVLLTSPPFGISTASRPDRFEPGSLRQLIEYHASRIGVRGAWQPDRWYRLSVAAGYEYFEMARNFAEYDTFSGPFRQEDTKTHQVYFGPYWRWSPEWNTFVRYKARFIEDPLIGVRENDGQFNTNQPEQEHGVEIGGTWIPASNFVASAQFGIENSWHNSTFADFDEDNYPLIVTVWHAPTDRLSLTAGYAYFSNWIDQDITIGFRDNPTETTQWSYGGRNYFYSIGAIYAWTESTRLVGGIEWNRGNNAFSVPASPAGADWLRLPFFSDVIVETRRVNAGIDHQLGPSLDSYFRYVHFDYEDESVDFNSGTADMFLAGVTWIR